ncbi:putative DNA polymerase [Exaiptasia diaphana]|nr:putative DNA polymerase [Exaiptasia diaphana]
MSLEHPELNNPLPPSLQPPAPLPSIDVFLDPPSSRSSSFSEDEEQAEQRRLLTDEATVARQELHDAMEEEWNERWRQQIPDSPEYFQDAQGWSDDDDDDDDDQDDDDETMLEAEFIADDSEDVESFLDGEWQKQLDQLRIEWDQDRSSRQDEFDRLLSDLLRDDAPAARPSQQGQGAPRRDQSDDVFRIQSMAQRRNKKFNATVMELRVGVNLRPRTDIGEALQATVGMIDQLLTQARAGANNQDMMRLMEAVAQSKKKFFLSGDMTVTVYHVRNGPTGGGPSDDEGTSDFLDAEAIEDKEEEEYVIVEEDQTGAKSMPRRKPIRDARIFFLDQKKNNPRAWLTKLCEKGNVVECVNAEGQVVRMQDQYDNVSFIAGSNSLREAILQHLISILHIPRSDSLCWIEQCDPQPFVEGTEMDNETLIGIFMEWNSRLQKDHHTRLVVLDWGNNDAPLFLGPKSGTLAEKPHLAILYKIGTGFHFVWDVIRLHHYDQGHLFCSDCCRFYNRKNKRHRCVNPFLNKVPLPKFRNSVRPRALEAEDLVDSKKSIVRIEKNPDNGCCFRAVALSLWLRAHPGGRSQNINKTKLETEARQLAQSAGLPFYHCGMVELHVLQQYLAVLGVRLHVYYQHLGAVGFAGDLSVFDPDTGPDHDVYLFHHDAHYDLIRSMTGFLNKAYFCNLCHKGYYNQKKHKCRPLCKCCYSHKIDCQPDEKEIDWKYCDKCNRSFKGDTCLANHLKNVLSKNRNYPKLQYSICERYQRCTQCKKVVDVLTRKKVAVFSDPRQRTLEGAHSCGEIYCTTCRQTKPQHWCHVQRITDELCFACQQKVAFPHACSVTGQTTTYDERFKVKYLFFDVETMPLEEHHEVNLVVAHKVCSECLSWTPEEEERKQCSTCGNNRRRWFRTQHEFCRWLFSPENFGYTVMAHNFKGYDSYFLLEYLCELSERPKVVFRGCKLLYMYYKPLDMKFKDSLNFLPMALRRFSKTFGLEEEKGHFPHFFNRPENQDYKGAMPPLADYGIATMGAEEAHALTVWWESRRNDEFDFKRELLYYCWKDVELLKRGVLAARRIFLDAAGFDPFHACVTLASACMEAYRRLFMPENSIGVIPEQGYRGAIMQSMKARRWLWWLMNRDPELNERLECCLKAKGERFVMGAPVDGYDEQTKKVFQFHGCYYHAYPECFPGHDAFGEGEKHREFSQRYYDTRRRTNLLRANGYEVIEMWEHEWDKIDVGGGVTVPLWLTYTDPLNPRDGLFGGRTNAVQLYCDVNEEPEGTRIDYVDFTSLYPSVMRQAGAYPTGHPTILVAGEAEISHRLTEHYYGLNKVKVLPPRKLYLPVLPIHMNGKLLFTLCRKAAKNDVSSQRGGTGHGGSVDDARDPQAWKEDPARPKYLIL